MKTNKIYDLICSLYYTQYWTLARAFCPLEEKTIEELLDIVIEESKNNKNKRWSIIRLMYFFKEYITVNNERPIFSEEISKKICSALKMALEIKGSNFWFPESRYNSSVPTILSCCKINEDIFLEYSDVLITHRNSLMKIKENEFLRTSDAVKLIIKMQELTGAKKHRKKNVLFTSWKDVEEKTFLAHEMDYRSLCTKLLNKAKDVKEKVSFEENWQNNVSLAYLTTEFANPYGSVLAKCPSVIRYFLDNYTIDEAIQNLSNGSLREFLKLQKTILYSSILICSDEYLDSLIKSSLFDKLFSYKSFMTFAFYSHKNVPENFKRKLCSNEFDVSKFSEAMKKAIIELKEDKNGIREELIKKIAYLSSIVNLNTQGYLEIANLLKLDTGKTAKYSFEINQFFSTEYFTNILCKYL